MPDPERHASVRWNRHEFATTHWSLVLRAGRDRSAASLEALEQLCRAYWYPLYAFARRQGCASHEAQDLTQEFFSRLLSKDHLQMADPSRGKFRSFLLASFKHMMANERRDATRQKRGGGARLFSLDEHQAEEQYQLEHADLQTPERLFEKRWAETTLSRVLDRLASEYSGHTFRFDDLKVFLIEARGSAAFADVALRLGVTEGALKSLVHRMRRRYAELFRDEVAQTVEKPEDVEEEIGYMLAVLSN